MSGKSMSEKSTTEFNTDPGSESRAHVATGRRGFLQATAATAATVLAGALSGATREAQAAESDNSKARLDGVHRLAVAAPGQHVLPPLPYANNALEPYIDAETMMLHHDKHHAAYVAGLNAAELALAEMHKTGKYDAVAAVSRDLAFHFAGHYNHVVFWNVMRAAKEAKQKPEGALLTAVMRDFGSVENLQAHFSAAALKVAGNGWGALMYAPVFDRLYVTAFSNHQDNQLTAAVPLLLCDVWEHAYYVTYRNNRGEYLKQWWNVVDWAAVEAHYAAHTQGKRA